MAPIRRQSIERSAVTWLAQLLLFIPALVAEWFVSRNDPRFWVITFVIGLVFLMLLCVAGLYAGRALRRRDRNGR